MEDVGVSVAAKIAEYSVHPTLQQLQYLFCVGKISRDVKIRKEELILKQGRVQELVQEAINKTDRIDGEVDKWKNDVESLIVEVENLEKQLRANNGCLRGWCPTWMRYRLCKKLANRTQRMIHLNTKSDHFNPFSHPVAIPDIEYHSSQNFKIFNSTRVAFDKLWHALHDDGSSIIGLWGMGGSGKTTLVIEVGKKVKESQLFDRVMLTTISQSPNIIQIQDEIADTMGLKLEEKSKIGRAKRIALRLHSGERILIILDDVWAMLNLEDIGIPFGGNNQSCKVVLTTRRLEVCSLMECQKVIQLDLLKKDEAWTLFQTHAHSNDAAKEVLARAIVVECKGLPIAIVAMGTCLKGKGVDEMNVMLYRLRNAKPNNVDKGVRDAFACLELSYDYLATPEAKLLLLMCAVFPEDYKIDVEDLLRYGVGLGLCADVDSFETIRSQVRATIKYLLDSSLLMHFSPKFSEGQEYVTVHDVVRDFALWKASEENRTIVVNCTKELNKLIDYEGLKDCYATSSWYGEENKFFPFHSELGAPKLTFELDAPKLKFLMLCSRTHLKISHASFVGAKGLQALVIMCINGPTMKVKPQSIQWSSNLQSLQLQNLDLCDISFVVSLTRLEILDLRGSKFGRIPDGIEKLNKLKLLDLSSCRIDECCYKIIGRCSQLEELYDSMHFLHSGNKNCYKFLMGPIALRKLRRYKLEIGHQPDRYSKIENEGVRYLFLSGLNMSMLGSIIKDLTQRATAIGFNELKGGSKCFMPNIVQAVGGMNDLTNLHLQRCSEIECIIDETAPHEDVVVPILEKLELRDMNNLKKLHLGAYPFSLFQKLERLSIFNCPQLLHIFPPDCNVGNLKFLNVSNCPKLTSLFPASVSCTLVSLEELKIECCNELKHVLEQEGGGDAWENSRFPKLKILSVRYCRKLEFVCPVSLALRFVQLQHLSLISAPKMKFMFDEGQLMHDQNETQILLPLLEYLQLENLSSLVLICSERYRRRWPSIKTIDWRDCPNMEWYEVKGHQLNNEELYKPLTAIERVHLDNCVAESIFHYQIGVEEQIPTFQYLKELTLKKCTGLKIAFYAYICRSLPELTSMVISCCKELEAIFSGNEETQKNISITKSCLPKLKKLEISHCDELKFILFDCEELEEIIAENGEHRIMSSVQVHFPKLRELKVERCNKLKRLFSTSAATIVLSSLRNIELRNMSNFTSVSPGRLQIQVELMRDINIRNCPKFVDLNVRSPLYKRTTTSELQELDDVQLRNEGFMPMVAMGRIQLDNCGVESIFHIEGGVEEQIPTFQYVKELTLEKCSRLKYVFSAHICQSLPELTSMAIYHCEELEAIFSGNEETQKSLSIDESYLPKLKNLKIFKCNKLKFVLSLMINGATSMLPQLSTLTILDCSQMEEVFKCSSIADNGIESERKIIFPTIKDMKLENLLRLVNVCQGFKLHVGESCRVEVHNCPKLMPIKDATIHWTKESLVREYVLKDSQLNINEALNLSLSGLDDGEIDSQSPIVEHNWRVIGDDEKEENNDRRMLMRSEQQMVGGGVVPTQVLSFQYLHSLEVTQSKKLKFVFSKRTVVQNSLPKLTSLTLSDCEQLEVIFGQCSEDDHNSDETIMLSGLKKIKLTNLPNFKNVCKGKLQIQVELMSDISISNCPKFVDSSMRSTLQQLGTISVSIEGSNGVETSSSVNEERGMILMISRAERLYLEDSMNLISVWEGPASIIFQNLRSLSVIGCRKLKCMFPSSVIKSLPCLEELQIEECEELEEIIILSSSEEEEHHHHHHLANNSSNPSLSFPLLFNLDVIRCSKLKCEELEEIIMSSLSSLEHHHHHHHFLNDSSNHSLCFPQLHNLDVIRCGKLKWLFPSLPSTQLLPQLGELTIKECSQLKELFNNSQVEIHEEEFFTDNNILPSLKYLTVEDCPIFSETTLAALESLAERNEMFSKLLG